MSKKTKDSKGLGKPKPANGVAKPGRVVAKGAVPVVKISPASARRPLDKADGKETKSGPPPAPEGTAAALPKRKLGLRGAAPWAARQAAKHAADMYSGMYDHEEAPRPAAKRHASRRHRRQRSAPAASRSLRD